MIGELEPSAAKIPTASISRLLTEGPYAERMAILVWLSGKHDGAGLLNSVLSGNETRDILDSLCQSKDPWLNQPARRILGK